MSIEALDLPTKTIRPTAVVETVANEPYSLITAADAIWMGSPHGLARIDPATNTSTVAEPTRGAKIVARGDFIWRSAFYVNRVTRYDTRTGKIDLTLDLPGPLGLSPSGPLWVSEHNDGRIVRLDEQTGKVVRDAVVGQPGTSGPAEIIPVDQDMLIVDPEGQAIVRADAETGTVKQQYHFDHWPCEQAGFAAGSVWLCLVDPTTEALSFGRFDPATGTLGPRYAVPVGPGSALLTAHTVWVGERDRLISFDPATGVPDRALRIDLEGADARYLLKVAGSIWVACADGRLLRFDPADFL